ncbi:MAG: hypothetical protein V4516_13535 [Pseudomonadota bacterium]
MASKKVRPNSRAAQVVKAMLDAGVVPHLGLQREARHQSTVKGTAFATAYDLLQWAAVRGMEVRPHDKVELHRYLREVVGYPWDNYDPPGQYDHNNNIVPLRPLVEARGRWMDATDGIHDFQDDRRSDWRFEDGTAPGH